MKVEDKSQPRISVDHTDTLSKTAFTTENTERTEKISKEPAYSEIRDI